MYSNNLLATVRLHSTPKVLTIQPGYFCNVEPNTGNTSVIIEEFLYERNDEPKAVLLSHKQSEKVKTNLATADIVVGGGRGLKTKETFELIHRLADTMHAAVGVTRAAADLGFAPYDLQIGQTGKVISPTIYFAIGISGATQHIAGIYLSKIIVAINTNREEPIFESSDIGLIGDATTIIPQLITKLSPNNNK
uniref:Electron transfer flavoprotein subunit alpha n=1 Tax=Lygus hesperus TaxID=30085 RepID=A0A0A9Z6P7_LYGHE